MQDGFVYKFLPNQFHFERQPVQHHLTDSTPRRASLSPDLTLARWHLHGHRQTVIKMEFVWIIFKPTKESPCYLFTGPSVQYKFSQFEEPGWLILLEEAKGCCCLLFTQRPLQISFLIAGASFLLPAHIDHRAVVCLQTSAYST